jgi:stage III sporulation protein AA
MEKTVLKNGKFAFETALGCIPSEIKDAILRYLARTNTPESAINEIRLREGGITSLVISGRNIPLNVTLDREKIKETFKRVCGGAVFAHREDLSRGFVTLSGGVRVGVCGYARYESGVVVGIGDISSLVFRIPTGQCSFARELYYTWRRNGGGMLICSGAGEGKTTAIRSLAGLIGSGERPFRVVVADERCEFNPAEYENAHVDILRGYKRALGVDIAIRTMSAEVLIVDEISSREDATAMLASVGAGVVVIATVHARSLEDAMKREYVASLIKGGLFENVCVISRRDGAFSYSFRRISNN